MWNCLVDNYSHCKAVHNQSKNITRVNSSLSDNWETELHRNALTSPHYAKLKGKTLPLNNFSDAASSVQLRSQCSRQVKPSPTIYRIE
jgi:hypothetical protein